MSQPEPRIRRHCICSRCGYEWMQKSPTRNPPVKCARDSCRSSLWNIPRRPGNRMGRPPGKRNGEGELIKGAKSARMESREK